MKMIPTLAAALVPLVAACLATAADDAGPKAAALQMPLVSVQSVTTDDASGYATWIAKANEAFKAAGGPDHFTHVYEASFAGDESGMVFAVRLAGSDTEMVKDTEALEKVPERFELLRHMAAIRKLGPASLLKAVYYEGGYSGEWLFITDAVVTGEPAYLQALKDLRGLLDSHDLKDIKINVFRVISGRSNHSHEVIISAPSQERNAAFMDAMTSTWATDWLAGLAGLRTVVHNGIYHDISK
jgi:hypothetical protein